MFPTATARVRFVCVLCVALAPTLAGADARKAARKARAAPIVATDALPRGCTYDDALASQRAPSTALDSAPADAAVAAEAARTLPPIARVDTTAQEIARQYVPVPADPHAGEAGVAAHDLRGGTAPLRFFDRDSLRAQVESLRRRPLFRLFDARRMSLYLGIDRKGVAGLHLQQRQPDELEPIADDAEFVDLPLRSVPIETR